MLRKESNTRNRYTILEIVCCKKIKYMDYILWYNRCKVEPSLVQSLSDARYLDLVRFIAWSGGEDFIKLQNSVCACPKCNKELSFLLLRCTERTLDKALDAEPILVERTRHTEKCGHNTFVHYSFAHPSTLDREALQSIVSYAGVKLLYVCTTFDSATNTEDASVFKLNLVKHKTPGCEKDTSWMVNSIRSATYCKAQKFEIRFVTYFTPFN